MKKTLKLFALLMVLLLALVGCSSGGGGSTPTQPDDTPTSNFVYEEGTELRVAAGYQKANEAISFQDAEITGEGVTLADGVTYHTGDLKPTWAYLSELLHITFTDKFSGAVFNATNM